MVISFDSLATFGFLGESGSSEAPSTILLTDAKYIVEMSSSDAPSKINIAFVLDEIQAGDDFTITIETGETGSLHAYHVFEITHDGAFKVNGEPWTERLGVALTFHEDHIGEITRTRNSGTDRTIAMQYYASPNLLVI